MHEGDKTWHTLLWPPGILEHYQLQLAAVTHGPACTALGKLEPRPLTVMGTFLIEIWLFLKTCETSDLLYEFKKKNGKKKKEVNVKLRDLNGNSIIWWKTVKAAKGRLKDH